MMKNLYGVAAWLGMTLLAGAPHWAMAATPSWPEVPFQYMAKKTPVVRALKDFTTTFGIKLYMDENIPGTLNGSYTTDNPTKFLDGVAASHGLTWYYYGGGLYVSRNSDAVTQTIHVGNSNMDVLRSSLQKLGILDSRFGWGEFAEHGTIVVSGPRSYVTLVSETLDSLGRTPIAGQVIRVFKLHHASVADRTFTYRDQQVVIPGVATVLRRLVEDGVDPVLGESSGTRPLQFARPLGVEPARQSVSADQPADTSAAGTASGRGILRSKAPSAIEADPRTNAVVLRGDPSMMPAYEAVIRDLDMPNALIEIEAAIVDISTERERELGIDWSLQYRKGTAGVGDTSPTTRPLTLTLGWENGADVFLSRVRALEGTGDAQILARPSVLTTSNQPAILDLSETFYIRLQGERVANAIPVSAGTLLRVTPRLVLEDGKKEVQLDVDIEDGQVQAVSVDGLPIVKKTTISTQALVGERQSLLIGGYYLQSTSTNDQRIPGLGSIPVVGALFSNKTANSQRRERLFMIMPRIIERNMVADLSSPAAAAGAQLLAPRTAEK